MRSLPIFNIIQMAECLWTKNIAFLDAPFFDTNKKFWLDKFEFLGLETSPYRSICINCV